MQETVTTDVLRAVNPLRLAGPVFDKELRVASRRRRTYLLRFLYIGALTWFVVMVLDVSVSGSNGGSAVVQAAQMGQLASRAVATIVWFEFLLAQLLAIVLLSGSIGNEIRQRSLDVLLTTPITSLQIVLGKFAGALLQLLLLLAVSLPLLAVVRVYGGVPWNYVIVSLCIILATALFTGALSLLVSVTDRHAYHVMSTVAGFCVLLWAGGAAAIGLLGLIDGFSRTTGQMLLYLTNPFCSLGVETATMATAVSSRWTAGLWPIHCAILLAAAALLLLLAARRVRRVALASGASAKGAVSDTKSTSSSVPAKPSPWRWRSSAVRRVQGSPIVWKERRRPLYRRRRGVLGILSTILVVLLMASLVVFFFVAAPTSLGRFCLAVAGLLQFLFVVSVAVSAASAITREKEGRTLTSLLVTPLESGWIIKDKAVGLLLRSLLILIPVPILGVVGAAFPPGFATGLPSLLFGLLTVILGETVFFLGLGLCMSVHLKTGVSAVVATFAGYLVVRILVDGFLGQAFRMLVQTGVLDPGQFWSRHGVAVIHVVVLGGVGLLLMWGAAKGLRRRCLAQL